MTMESRQLLAEYVRTGSETAFRELVANYLGLVYSAALRLTGGNTHSAEEITQTVFIGLAQKARTLSSEVMLGGWLHQYTFHAATKFVRAERRRQIREQEAGEMNALTNGAPEEWRKIEPILDEAILELGDEDRAAILLRFFEQRDFRAIGASLGGSEDAARMRVNRALDKLQVVLKRRGAALSVGALGAVLAAHTASAVPAGLASAVAGAAFANVGGGVSTIMIKLMALTKLQTGMIGALVVAGAMTPWAMQQHAKWRETDAALQSQNEKMGALVDENARLSNQMALAKDSRGLSQKELDELMRLRNQTTALNKQLAAAKVTPVAAGTGQTNVALSPEEEERQKAIEELQTIEKMDSAKNWLLAFMMYANDNQNRLPGDFSQATNYLSKDKQMELLLATNQFEVRYGGPLNTLKDPSSVAILEEITSPGATLKTYGFADGHVEVVKRADGDFKGWEAQRLTVPPSGQ
ncbi:MAG TPA: sigma-70 family RNA polymerase sigma factor [Verrucomicrobiae bacterium]|nr:sigma-70 family RNA polymerase sigma factor [Verrucomicrobiae bacterium]